MAQAARYLFVAVEASGRILTDGAAGFLPGVPLGCLRMWDQESI
jgi:hypothetical protein